VISVRAEPVEALLFHYQMEGTMTKLKLTSTVKAAG
jgi:hypothetical protein